MGNIAYEGKIFDEQLQPVIRHLRNGLQNTEDERMMVNTISTISNLLRHNDANVQELISSGVMKRAMELFGNPSSSKILMYLMSMMKKAVKYEQFVEVYSKESINTMLEYLISQGLCDSRSDEVLNLKNKLR